MGNLQQWWNSAFLRSTTSAFTVQDIDAITIRFLAKMAVQFCTNYEKRRSKHYLLYHSVGWLGKEVFIGFLVQVKYMQETFRHFNVLILQVKVLDISNNRLYGLDGFKDLAKHASSLHSIKMRNNQVQEYLLTLI